MQTSSSFLNCLYCTSAVDFGLTRRSGCWRLALCAIKKNKQLWSGPHSSFCSAGILWLHTPMSATCIPVQMLILQLVEAAWPARINVSVWLTAREEESLNTSIWQEFVLVIQPHLTSLATAVRGLSRSLRERSNVKYLKYTQALKKKKTTSF